DHDQSALPQLINQSAAGWPALFLGHFAAHEGSEESESTEAGPDVHLPRADCFAQSRVDFFCRTAGCRPPLQTEPRQTFVNLLFPGACQSKCARVISKPATG